MRYRPSIAERIAWSLGQLSSADGKVLAALWSCGDFNTGRNCRPSLVTLAERSDTSTGTVKRSLRRLANPAQAGGPWIVVTGRHHRCPTTYDLVLDRLAESPLVQQMPMPIDAVNLNLEDQNDPQAVLEDQNDPQNFGDRNLEDQNDPQGAPITFLEDQNDPPPVRTEEHTHTRTARARENDDDRAGLPLFGRVPRPACKHPNMHAWCDGRVHVPKDLHYELIERLGTKPGASPSDRLFAFYAETMGTIPEDQPIGSNAYEFWRKAFDAWVSRAAFVPKAPPRDVYAEADEQRRRRNATDWR